VKALVAQELSGPPALAFDVLVTVVDWRSGVTAELEAFGETHGVQRDWPTFADDWRKTSGRQVGLRAPYATRPLEYGPDQRPPRVTDGEFDNTATDFPDLADQLDA
jgi:hypothetical protein